MRYNQWHVVGLVTLYRYIYYLVHRNRCDWTIMMQRARAERVEGKGQIGGCTGCIWFRFAIETNN